MLEALILATILCGFFGIIWKQNLVMKIISMDIMSTGVIAYYVFIASRTGLFVPIVGKREDVTFADPVPQAVILLVSLVFRHPTQLFSESFIS